MAASNRATRITKLVTAVKKKFKPVAPNGDRDLLENLLFACLLENSLHEAAEAAYLKLKQEYFDWNEVRVSTRKELAEHLKELTDPYDSADRIKRTLQSVFEGVFSFDLEELKKQNLGKTIKQFQSYKGITPFVISYATQTSLGGHSIPINQGLFTTFVTLDIITPAEAKSGTAPGLERTVPKSKGVEVGSMLHQVGVEVGKNPYGQNARKLLLALDPSCKDRLPKRPAKKAPEPKPKKKQKSITKAAEDAKARSQADSKGAANKKAPPAKQTPGKPVKKKAVPGKSANVKKKKTAKPAPGKKKKVVKKAVSAKGVKKKVVKKKAAKKRKPK